MAAPATTRPCWRVLAADSAVVATPKHRGCGWDDRGVGWHGDRKAADARAGGCGVREIARQLGRSASTISRELRRNAATGGGRLDYRATTAQWHADQRARRPKTAKLATSQALRDYVQDRLAGMLTAADGTPVPGPPCRVRVASGLSGVVFSAVGVLVGELLVEGAGCFVEGVVGFQVFLV
jgi:Helix-turn-helix domain